MFELTLPGFRGVEDPRSIGFSYSHDCDAAFGADALRAYRETRTPLGDGILEHYTTYEVVPR